MTGLTGICFCTAIGALTVGSALAGTTVEGRLVGHDGDPISPSHVQLVRPASDDEVALVEVGEDGRYSLTTDAAGVVLARFAALGHEPVDIPLHLDGSTVEVDARLSTYRYNETFENLTLRGDMNAWRTGRAPQLSRDFDGQYFAAFKSKADSLSYQVMGAVPGRSVAGTDAASYTYDGHGDYRSVVRSFDGQAVITFDPELLVSSDRESSFSIDDDHERWLAMREVTEVMEARKDGYQSILSRARRQQSDPGPGLTELRKDLPAVLTALESERDPDLRTARLLEAIQLDRMSRVAGGADSGLVIRAMEELAPDSPFWSLAPEVIGFVVKHSGGFPAHKPWLDTMIADHPDPDVRKNALVRAVNYAEQLGQEDLRDGYFMRLREEFPDSQELAYVTQQVLRGKIVPGKNAPEFSVASLDAPDTPITLASLRGKTVLLDFWATWCKPCVAEMGNLHEVYAEYGGDEFEIVSFSFDRKAEAIPKFRDGQWPMPWLHSYVDEGFKSSIAEQFGVASLPKPILIDPEGTVLAVGRDLRGERLRPAISAALDLQK